MKPIYKTSFFFVIPFLLYFTTSSEAQKADPKAFLGIWYNQEKDGRIELFLKDNKLFGKIIWLKDPLNENGRPKMDKNNPDPANHKNPILGMVFLNALEWDGKEKWDDGTVYDPKSGKTYSAQLKLINANTIEITGFIGFSFIGKTNTWTRFNEL